MSFDKIMLLTAILAIAAFLVAIWRNHGNKALAAMLIAAACGVAAVINDKNGASEVSTHARQAQRSSP